jgi:hypothetical protein
VGIIWIWANMHASFPLGLALIGWYAVAEFWNTRTSGGKHYREFGLAALASALIALVTPSGTEAYLYLFRIAEGVNALHIAEWTPIQENLGSLWGKACLALILAGDAFVVWWFLKKSEILFPGIVLGVSILPLISIRHIGYWPLAALYPLALAMSHMAIRKLGSIPERRAFQAVLIFFLIFLGLRYVLAPRYTVNPETIPVYAANFAEEEQLSGRRFNLYNEGGYLIWRFWPKEKVFIDGRSEVYGRAEIDKFLRVATGQPGWEEIADQYGINQFFLAYRPSSLAESIYPLVFQLMQRNWALVYWDDSAVIFVRDIPEHRNVIANYGLRHVSPFRDPGDIRPDERKAALEELRRLLIISPQNKTVAIYATHVLSAAQEE